MKNYGRSFFLPLTVPVRWATYAPALGGAVTISGQVSILESGRFGSPRTFAFDLLKSSRFRVGFTGLDDGSLFPLFRPA